METKSKITNTDEYIAQFPPDRQKLLKQMRATIRAAAPDAKEQLGYAMPAFYQDGYLVYFSNLKNAIGFYPTPSGIAAYPKEVAKYSATKGALNFPVDEPLPLKLVTKIVKFRLAENKKKAKAKASKKK